MAVGHGGEKREDLTESEAFSFPCSPKNFTFVSSTKNLVSLFALLLPNSDCWCMAKRAKLLADQIMEGKAKDAPPPPKNGAPLSALLDMCLEACEAMQPLVQAVYDLLETSADAKTTKADASVFTIADGLVQALLYRSLRGMLGGIVGEEDDAETECETPPFKAGGLPVPEGRLSDLVVAARTAMRPWPSSRRARRRLPFTKLLEAGGIDHHRTEIAGIIEHPGFGHALSQFLRERDISRWNPRDRFNLPAGSTGS